MTFFYCSVMILGMGRTVVKLCAISFHKWFHCRSFQPFYCIIVGSRKSLQTTVRGHSFTICEIVCAVPHSHLSEDRRPHLWTFAAQEPLRVQKWFSAHHLQWGRMKSGCQIVVLVTSDCLTTVADFLESHHASFKLVDAMSVQIERQDLRCWGEWSKMSLWTCHSRYICTLSRKNISCCLLL